VTRAAVSSTRFHPSFQRLSRILKGTGIRHTLSACLSVVEDHWLKCFDRIYGVQTSGYISLANTSVDPSRLPHANRYGPVNAWAFRKLLRNLDLPRTSHFVDLGCGLGRACILAAQYGFAKVTGVELAPELCDIARDNISRCRSAASRAIPINIIQADASDYCEHTDGDVFFMYRPFSWEFLQIVLSKLADRAAERTKSLTIIYSERLNLPESFAKAFSQNPLFHRMRQFRALGQQFYVYRCGLQSISDSSVSTRPNAAVVRTSIQGALFSSGNEKRSVAVRLFRTFEGICELRGPWKAWQRVHDVDFELYEKIRSWDGVEVSPYVIVLYDNERPVTILVGKVGKNDLSWRTGFWTLKPKANVIEFPRGSLLGDSRVENCRVLVDAIIRGLGRGHGDVAVFKGLESGTTFCNEALKTPGFISRDHVARWRTHWGMTVPSSLEAFYLRFSSHRRSEIRRKMRTFLAACSDGLSIRLFRDPIELEVMVGHLETVANKSFQRRLGGGFRDSEHIRELLRAQAERGLLRCFVLFNRETPIGFWLGLRYGVTFSGQYMAHDRAYNRFSPGIFLTMKVIEQFCGAAADERVSFIDYGTGDYPYKEWLCDQKHKEAFVHVFAPTFKGALLNALRTPAVASDKVARDLAARANLLNRARKIQRLAS
jgi:SAM-dependent methyltransferase